MKQINNYIMRNSFFGKGALIRISAFSRLCVSKHLIILISLFAIITKVDAKITITPNDDNHDRATCIELCDNKWEISASTNKNYVFNVSGEPIKTITGSVSIGNTSYSIYACNWSKVNYGIGTSTNTFYNGTHTFYIIYENNTLTLMDTQPQCGPSLTATCVAPTPVSAGGWVRFCSIEGSSLSQNITISSSQGDNSAMEFGISNNASEVPTNTSSSIDHGSGTLSTTYVWARTKSGQSAGFYDETVTFTSGTASESCSVSGIVGPYISVPACPTSLVKDNAIQMTVVCVASVGHTLTVSSSTNIEFSTDGTNFSSSIDITSLSTPTHTFWVKYTGTNNINNGSITFDLKGSNGTTITGCNPTCNSINCSNWAPSISCYSYYVNGGDTITVHKVSGTDNAYYFDLTLSTQEVRNPADDNSTDDEIAWGAVKIDVSGMGVNSVGTTLPTVINSSAGLYCGRGNNTYDGAEFYTQNNNDAQSSYSPSFNNNDHKSYWSCNTNSSCGDIGYIRIDDNGNNRKKANPDKAPLHETHRIYFYKDNGDHLYYGFDYLPTVTLTTSPNCQSTSGETVTITATVQNMVASGLTYTLYKDGNQVSQVTESTLTKTFSVTDAGNYYVTVDGKQDQMEKVTNTTITPNADNRLSVFRTSNTVRVGRCDGLVDPTISANAKEFCPEEDVTISVPTQTLLNSKTATSWQWYKNGAAIGTPATTYSDLVISNATDGDNGRYKLGVEIGGDWYYSDSVEISALPTTITATPASLSFNADGQQTITIAPTCATISDVSITTNPMLDGSGTPVSGFTITDQDFSDLRNGGSFKVNLPTDVFNDLADGDYTGGAITISSSAGDEPVGLEVSKVSCKESNVVVLDFGTGDDNKEISEFTSPVNYSDYIQLKVNTYSSSFSDWAKRYAITPLRSSSNASNMSGINSSNTNRMLAFTLFSNDNNDNNKYHDLFIVKAPNNIDDNTYKIILKAKSIGHSDTYKNSNVKIKGTSESVDGSWKNISFIVSKAELTTGVLIQAYRENDTRVAYAFDDITITSVCPPKVSIESTGNACNGDATLTANVNNQHGTPSYVWTTTGGTIKGSSTSQSVTINGAGIYTVTVTDSQTGLSSDKSYTVVCAPEITAANPAEYIVCLPDTVENTITYNNYTGYTVVGFRIYNASDAIVKDTVLATSDNTSGNGKTIKIKDIPVETRTIGNNDYYSATIRYIIGSNTSDTLETLKFADFKLKPMQMCQAEITEIGEVDICNSSVDVSNVLSNREVSPFNGFELRIYTDEACESLAGTGKFTIEANSTSFTVNKVAAASDGSITTYYIKAVSTASGDNSETPAKSFTVKQTADCGGAAVSLASTTNFCNGRTITLTATPENINMDMDAVKYRFFRGNNEISAAGGQKGNTFEYTVPAGEAENSITFSVKVDSADVNLAVANATANRSNVSIATPTLATSVATPTTCDSFSVTAGDVTVNNGTNGTEFNYFWTIGDATQDEQTATLTDGKLVINPLSQADGVTTTTTYTLTIKAGNGLCEDYVSATKTITPTECTTLTLAEEFGFCEKETITLEPEGTTTATGLTYSWYACDAQGTTSGDILSTNRQLQLTEPTNVTFGTEYYYKFTAYNGQTAIFSGVTRVFSRTDCVQEYYVRDNVTNSGNGSSWDAAAAAKGNGAFKTLDEALDSAKAVHSRDANKRVAIYVATESSSAYTVSNTDSHNTLSNTSIYGGFANSTHTDGTKHDDADGYTKVKSSSTSNVTFLAGSGENVLSHLEFNNATNKRVIEDASATEANYLTLDSCKFSGNTGGAIKFNSKGGGELTIYSGQFSGNNTSASKDGGSISIEGPYELRITTKDDTKYPNITTYTRDWDRNCPDGTTAKAMSVSLLDSTTVDNCANVFDTEVNTGNSTINSVRKGGCIYLKGLSYALIESSLFKNNSLKSNTNAYGLCIYMDEVNAVEIKKSFFNNNTIDGSRENEGTSAAGVYAVNIANAEYSYLWFGGNSLTNKGQGAAFTSLASQLNVKNSYFGYGTVKDGKAGGLYASDASLVVIDESLFKKNMLKSGSGICGGCFVKNAAVNVSNTIFEGNNARQSGGGFYTEAKSNSYDQNNLVSLTKCLFYENEVEDGNGKGPALTANYTNIKISKCEFYNNQYAEGSGTVDLQNCYAEIFSSSFIKNHFKSTHNQGTGCIYANGNSFGNSGGVNIFVINSTFSDNRGSQYGIIHVANYAKADITSCTIVDNCAYGNVLHKSDNGAFNLRNSIIAGNKNCDNSSTSLDNVRADASAFDYNTIGNTIYFGNSVITNENIGCSPAFRTDSLMNYCSYGPYIMSTKPFKEDKQQCRMYGMSRAELIEYAGENKTLLNEVLYDEHAAPRGWRNLTESESSEDLAGTDRTYQGAVEGGTSLYEGKKISPEFAKMPAMCTGGTLHQPKISVDINVEKDDKGDFYFNDEDMVSNKFEITLYKQNDDSYELYQKERPISSLSKKGEGKYEKEYEVPSGSYKVDVCRYNDEGTLKEKYTEYIEIPNVQITDLTWIGGTSGDYNNLNNWRIGTPDNLGDVPSASDIAEGHPTSCQNVHIGWDNPYTDAVDNVLNLPTIVDNSFPNPEDDGATNIQYGECANIYFHPNGSLGQIHKLSYNKAFVELELTPYGKNSTSQAWSLLAPPLKEVYSGDYYRDTMYSYMRYVRLKNDNGLKATWSVSIPTLDIDLTNMHTGFAFRFSHSNGAMDNYIYEFPNTRTDYTYYNENTHAEAGNTSVKKSDLRHRFITEDDNNVFIENWTKDIDLANNTDFRESATATGNLTNATGYIAIANPYMSHLDLDAFLEDNKDVIENTAQLFTQSNQSFVSYTQNTSGGKNENMTKYVSPMQTFWIKPKTLAASISLNFNAAHISVAAPTDEVKNKLRNSEAKANMLKMTAQYGENTSPVRYVYAAPNASNGFKSEEDVPFILGQSDPVDIYTQTDEINLSMNMVDADGLTDLNIPVSVHTLKSGSVTVRIDGVENFEEADDIFWVDAEKNTKESLLETKKFTYNLAKGETEGRFSILFKQKKRVKMETSGSVCQGDAYTFYGQPVGTATPGKVSSRIVREGADADTAFSITLKVNPIYFVDVEATINEGEDYTENGFSILNAKAGSYEKKLFLDSREGCDSIITLSLTVNPTLYKALVYNGTDEPVEKWVTEDGTGLGLTGNALAYFEDVVPDALCSMTNVICKNGGSYSASKISLTADADFYAPYTFTADEIEFSHKPVAASEANGWQTIVLPFTATDFRNSGSADGMAASRLTPFNESDARKNGDFWLKPFSSSTINGIGFGYPQASELKANTPYIVAYPGSSYGSKYSLEGQTITYSASSAVVEKTPSPIIKELGDYSVIGVTAATEVKNAYMLDVEKNSFCLAESGTAAPFTCYVLSEGGARTRSLTIYDDDDDDDRILTDTDGLTADGPALFAVIVKEKMAYIYASKAGKADVTDMTGRKVLRSVEYGKGMTAVGTLPAGAYIIGGVKTVIK